MKISLRSLSCPVQALAVLAAMSVVACSAAPPEDSAETEHAAQESQALATETCTPAVGPERTQTCCYPSQFGDEACVRCSAGKCGPPYIQGP
jgi:hypothetical protein